MVRSSIAFPAPVPEIPAADLGKAIEYYVQNLGFGLDWRIDKHGIAGVSRDDCRLFIASSSLRELYHKGGPIMFWLNLGSRGEVDELFAEWKAAKANLLSEPEDKPHKLHEFHATDLDGNLIRVFYDFAFETKDPGERGPV